MSSCKFDNFVLAPMFVSVSNTHTPPRAAGSVFGHSRALPLGLWGGGSPASPSHGGASSWATGAQPEPGFWEQEPTTKAQHRLCGSLSRRAAPGPHLSCSVILQKQLIKSSIFPGSVCAEWAPAFPSLLQKPSQSHTVSVASRALSCASAPPYCAALIHIWMWVF